MVGSIRRTEELATRIIEHSEITGSTPEYLHWHWWDGKTVLDKAMLLNYNTYKNIFAKTRR